MTAVCRALAVVCVCVSGYLLFVTVCASPLAIFFAALECSFSRSAVRYNLIISTRAERAVCKLWDAQLWPDVQPVFMPSSALNCGYL